jgi:hypothetical protein
VRGIVVFPFVSYIFSWIGVQEPDISDAAEVGVCAIWSLGRAGR